MPRSKSSSILPPNTSGLCLCGCGQPAPIASQTRRALGVVKGQPMWYISGHNKRSNTYTVDPNTECWNWTGAPGGKGYGVAHDGKPVKAHRWMYEKLVGPVPDGMQLDHLCRNRRCVNPAHLEPVTNAENSRRGVNAKIDFATARRIHEMLETHSPKQVSEALGVSRHIVKNIAYHGCWADAKPHH